MTSPSTGRATSMSPTARRPSSGAFRREAGRPSPGSLTPPFPRPGLRAWTGRPSIPAAPTCTAPRAISGTGVYRVPLDNPSIAAVQLVHLFYGPPPPVFSSDDSELHGMFGVSAIAFGSSGNLYVTLMGANQVSVLRPDGSEERRFPDLQNPGPYDAPLFPAFDGHGYL